MSSSQSLSCGRAPAMSAFPARVARSPGNSSATRYLAETRMFSDENTGNEEKAVQVARRTFRLLFGDEYRDGFSALRIAQVTRNAAGIPILNPRFIAPCLNLGSSNYLSMMLRRQIETLPRRAPLFQVHAGSAEKSQPTFRLRKRRTSGCCTPSTPTPAGVKHIWEVCRAIASRLPGDAAAGRRPLHFRSRHAPRIYLITTTTI